MSTEPDVPLAEGSATRRISWGLWLVVSLAVVVLDQLTKLQVTEALVLYQRVPVMPFLTHLSLSLIEDSQTHLHGFIPKTGVSLIGEKSVLYQAPTPGKLDY
jgi:hypothetical protein